MRIEAIGCEPLQLKRVHLENSQSLDVYRRNGGYEALKKVLDGMSPDDVINGQKISLAWTRRRGFSDRHEMEFRAERLAETKIRCLQR
jgi:NADH:ubiquinone oxidoreductase subunit F (NADH-binding)